MREGEGDGREERAMDERTDRRAQLHGRVWRGGGLSLSRELHEAQWVPRHASRCTDAVRQGIREGRGGEGEEAGVREERASISWPPGVDRMKVSQLCVPLVVGAYVTCGTAGNTYGRQYVSGVCAQAKGWMELPHHIQV